MRNEVKFEEVNFMVPLSTIKKPIIIVAQIPGHKDYRFFFFFPHPRLARVL